MDAAEQTNIVNNGLSISQTLLRWALKAGVVIALTLLLLELATQILWWNQTTITLFDRSLTLLPSPIVTAEQVEILSTWTENPNRYIQFDPVLGWSLRPNATGTQQGAVYTANSVGMRGLREYSLEKPENITRIGTFGPSFTHGDEVSDQATWQAQMEQARSDLEVMNWGVGGYGTDQAFLRYQTQGAAYQPDIVIIGFEEDNLRRNVNHFRPFFRSQTGLPLTKPVFVINEDRLQLIDNPYPEFEQLREVILNHPIEFLDVVCPYDYYCDRIRYQPLALDVFKSARFFRTLAYEMDRANRPETSSVQDPYVQRTNLMLIQMFVEEIIRNGSTPVVLLFPERQSIEAHEQGKRTAYEAGVTLLEEQGLEVIDLAPAFVHAKNTENLNYLDYYASDGGHFNQLGNYIVSQTVLIHLCQAGLLEDCS